MGKRFINDRITLVRITLIFTFLMVVGGSVWILGKTKDSAPLREFPKLEKVIFSRPAPPLTESRGIHLKSLFWEAKFSSSKRCDLLVPRSQLPQDAEIVLTCVYDNYQINPDLQTDWGFACVIHTPQGELLFDTGGKANILLSNMNKMGIEPGSISLVFISHVHGDHLGGLPGFLKKNNQVTVFIPHTFPASVKEMIKARGAKYVEISEHRKITDSIYSTGVLSGPPSEQSLIINTHKGLVIVTGCAHPGICRIVKQAKDLLHQEIYLVVGGFHHPPLEVVQEFRKLGVKKVAPSHCTGDQVREAFRREYGQDFIEFGVGKIIRIKDTL